MPPGLGMPPKLRENRMGSGPMPASSSKVMAEPMPDAVTLWSALGVPPYEEWGPWLGGGCTPACSESWTGSMGPAAVAECGLGQSGCSAVRCTGPACAAGISCLKRRLHT